MTTVQDILTFMEGLAPYELAESWDNVGLLCGDRAQEVTSVLCALDVTETVVQEAAERGAQLVVAHHPAIFTSVSRVTSDDTTGRVLRYAIKHDISIICMHTNADCAEGGVNDALASALFLTNVVSMEAGENGMLGRVGDLPREMQPHEFVLLNGRAYKVKTKIYLPRFVYAPVKSGDKIGLALFYYNDVEIARTDITAVEDAMLAPPPIWTGPTARAAAPRK